MPVGKRSGGGARARWNSSIALKDLTNTSAVARSIAKRNRRSRRRSSSAKRAEPQYRHSDSDEERGQTEESGEITGEEECCCGVNGDTCRDDQHPSPDSSFQRSLCERLNPREHKLVYVSPDRREGHFLVAARTGQTYHSSPRDFVFIGFRFLLCRGGSKVLVAWCGAERDCPEPPSRRDLFPGRDCHEMDPQEFQPGSCICPCAAKLLLHIGGSSWLASKLAMGEGEAKEQSEHGQSLLGYWELHRRNYTYVNPQDGGHNLFRQWGVVRSVNEGYSCQVCEGRPRHCRHTQVIVGEEGRRGATHMSGEEFDKKIRQATDPVTGKLRVKSLSQKPLPFFAEDDEVVRSQFQGESKHVLAYAILSLQHM